MNVKHRSKAVLSALLLVGSVSAMQDNYSNSGATISDVFQLIQSMERRHSEEMKTLKEQQQAQIDQLTKLLNETRTALDKANDERAMQLLKHQNELKMEEERRHNMEMEKIERERSMRLTQQTLLENFLSIRDQVDARRIGINHLQRLQESDARINELNQSINGLRRSLGIN